MEGNSTSSSALPATTLQDTLSELVRLLEEHNRLLQQERRPMDHVHDTLPPTVDQPNEQGMRASAARLGVPQRGRWGSLAAFLMYSISLSAKYNFMEEGLEDEKNKCLTLAKNTFTYILEVLNERTSRCDNWLYVSPEVLRTFLSERDKWPFKSPLEGSFDPEPPFQSEAYVHLSARGEDVATSGAIWTVPMTSNAGFQLRYPSLGFASLMGIVCLLHSVYSTPGLFSSPYLDFMVSYLAGVRYHPSTSSNFPDKTHALFLEFHLRCFRKGLFSRSAEAMDRSLGVVPRLMEAPDLGIREQRRALALVCNFGQSPGPGELDRARLPASYLALRLLDDGRDEAPREVKLSKASGALQLCVQPWTGLAVFQRLLHQEIDWWTSSWLEVLDTVDSLVAFEITDVLHPVSRQKLMYDDHKLKRSEMYFTVLQLLRIFEDWASDLVEDVEALIPPVREKMRQRLVAHESEAEAHAIIEDNWKLLIAHAQDSKTDVVGQIERRKQEVSSLRDGLYNTMQVREATRSTKMNLIMLMFTVATIIYLPPTFVATFMALDLFQASDKSQFWHIFAGMCAATYALATLGLVAIYRKSSLDLVRSGLDNLVRAFQGLRNFSEPVFGRVRKPSRPHNGRQGWTNARHIDLERVPQSPARRRQNPLQDHMPGFVPVGWQCVRPPGGESYFVSEGNDASSGEQSIEWSRLLETLSHLQRRPPSQPQSVRQDPKPGARRASTEVK